MLVLLLHWPNLQIVSVLLKKTQVKKKTYKSMWCYSIQVTTYFARANKHNIELPLFACGFECNRDV